MDTMIDFNIYLYENVEKIDFIKNPPKTVEDKIKFYIKWYPSSLAGKYSRYKVLSQWFLDIGNGLEITDKGELSSGGYDTYNEEYKIEYDKNKFIKNKESLKVHNCDNVYNKIFSGDYVINSHYKFFKSIGGHDGDEIFHYPSFTLNKIELLKNYKLFNNEYKKLFLELIDFLTIDSFKENEKYNFFIDIHNTISDNKKEFYKNRNKDEYEEAIKVNKKWNDLSLKEKKDLLDLRKNYN